MSNIKDLTSISIIDDILRRSVNVDTIATTLIDHWSYDLYSRKPGPALLDNGTLIPTDLDMACFLSALVDRRAVISLPEYKRARARSVKADQTVMSNRDRHGNVIGLTSNANTFAFGVRINDVNVVNTDADGNQTVGAPRVYLLTDMEGDWYDGWKTIQFLPTAKENAFLNDKSLWTDNQLVFKYFVHPNRWTSFYGQYYLLTKLVIDRLREEASTLRAMIREYKSYGIGGEEEKPDYPKPTAGPSKAVKIQSLECIVEVPFTSDFQRPHFEGSLEKQLQAAKDRLQYVQYRMLAPLSFAARITEYAFFRHVQVQGQDTTPTWVTASWDQGYKQKGKRKQWNRLALKQVYPWTKSLAILYRIYEKTERVAE